MTITTLILLLATGIVVITAKNYQINEDKFITSCCELSPFTFTFARGINTPGVYMLNNFCGHDRVKAAAYCDPISGGGGWLVVQRRQDGSGDFNRTWVEYEGGFGKLTGEFWFGLKALHCLIGQGDWEMRMDIKLANGTKIFLQYEQFKVASAKDLYKLSVKGYRGTIPDPMRYHNGMNFTTKDRDNDQERYGNCAMQYGPTQPSGGWWFKYCRTINPNIFYNHPIALTFDGKWYTLPFTEIKIRPHKCKF